MTPERFLPRVLLRQALVLLVAGLAAGLLAPRLLGIDPDIAVHVQGRLATITAIALVVTLATTVARVRAHRFLLRALALDSSAIEPEELGALGELPGALTLWFVVLNVASAALLFIPGIRPDRLDHGRSISLFILAVTTLGAAAIPHYVLLRAATMSLIERGPGEPLALLLDVLELRAEPERSVRLKLLLATVLPAALIGAATVLIMHAHLRSFAEASLRETAELIAHASLEPAQSPLGNSGRLDAVAAAAEFGFITRIERASAAAGPAWLRESDGQITVRTPLDDGRASTRFTARLDPTVASIGVGIGALAVALAALLGSLLGRALSRDLALATRGVRALGTEAILRGSTRIARRARFDVVRRLTGAVEGLAERFGIFAAAQERALYARDTAQRMRGLLFASMSHDLKSPLNAVLGFADLISLEDLTAAQRESLAMISTRGRELLALIETILDAARVEAHQLELLLQPASVTELIDDAVNRARELSVDSRALVTVDLDDDLPTLPVDRAYLPRALAVIVAHALRSAELDGVVRVSASRPNVGDKVRIHIEHAPAATRSRQRDSAASSRGRFLRLGLSLARSVITLHGGSIEVDPDRSEVATIWLPIERPASLGRRRAPRPVTASDVAARSAPSSASDAASPSPQGRSQ
jgi:signal transduction histidine kinase